MTNSKESRTMTEVSQMLKLRRMGVDLDELNRPKTGKPKQAKPPKGKPENGRR